MTKINSLRQQQSLRLGELAKLARNRYLEAGGDPHQAANGNEWLTERERQEYLSLARQVFDRESIDNYLQSHSSLKARHAKF